MNHRPFEDWLLADERLSSEQTRELQSHLRVCASCAALAEVNLALRSAKTVSPKPGFTARWQLKLAERLQVQRKRQLLGGLILVMGTLGLLAWFIAPWLSTALRSLVEFIASWIGYLVFVVTTVQAFSQAGSVLLRVLPGFITPYMWMVIASTATGICLLWIVSIWKFSRIPQGV